MSDGIARLHDDASMSELNRSLLGPVMVDVAGITLCDAERERLLHPACGGVILFARNYASPQQIAALVAEIRALRTPPLLIAVDQEGGRVQRFRDQFLALPPPRHLGERYAEAPETARRESERYGWLMASECRAVGVDFSFAPVLDLDHGNSSVIGDRALHTDPEAVADLATAFMRGMHHAGMAAVGKHFPGHGYVAADSHTDLPRDHREFAAIERLDLQPFAALIRAGLDAVMPAHVVYSACDAQPAGFSRFWLRDVLRARLGFQGVIFSDDLSMAGAGLAGGPVERAVAASEAGCDMLLVCNQPEAADAVLEAIAARPRDRGSRERLEGMRGREAPNWLALHESGAWKEALASIG